MAMESCDCPLCMGVMSEADLTYPTMCPTNCGYNFCLTCVDHLLSSSQDDFQESSDGNLHKVQALCPQCRAEFIDPSLQDTIVLRKAHMSSQYQDLRDSELNASELRQKHDYVQWYAKELTHAKARYRKYLQRTGQQCDGGSANANEENGDDINGHRENEREDNNGADADGDGDGEIDLVSAEPKQQMSPARKYANKTRRADKFLDKTLFAGLESVMSEVEQEYVQQLMTVGKAESLVQAAQILHGIAQLMLQGKIKVAGGQSPRKTMQQEREQIELDSVFRKLYPLPSRMPRYATFEVFPPKKRFIVFEDDEWDGSISDAFTRVHVTRSLLMRGGRNGGRMSAHPNMENMLDQAVQMEPKPRVKIRSCRGPVGRTGLQRGDIVTHVQGELWKGTAEELTGFVGRLYEEDPECTLQLIVNADDCTAEALKLRWESCRRVKFTKDLLHM